jgi:glycosyltransferase involved in cell wall biosynthesis
VRILTVGNLYPPHAPGGGYERTWQSAVEHLRAAGEDVRVLTSDHRAAGVATDSPGVARELRWYWRDHAFPRMGLRQRLALERHNAAVMERQLADYRPDVVSWWAMGGMSLGLIEQVRRARVPAFGVVGDNWMTYGPMFDRWQRPFRSRLGRRLAGPAERVTGLPARIDLSSAGPWLFNSHATRASAEDAGWRLRDARVAHPGVNLELFKAAPEKRWRWRFLYLGRVEERKGVDIAVDVLAELPGATRLRVVGPGEKRYLDALRSRARLAGVGDRVEFAEVPREAVPAELAGVDVLLFPVRWEEPWGLVPLEAMAAGIPVVATGTGGSAEYLRDAENCLIFDVSGGASALARALRRLSDDPELRARLRATGLRTAASYSERDYNETIHECALEAPGWSV